MNTDEQQIMHNLHSKIGGLDERTRNLESRLTGLEHNINESLKNIRDEIRASNKTHSDVVVEIDKKVDEINGHILQMKGGYKTIGVIISIIIVMSGFFAWMVDKWGIITSTFFGA